MPTLSSAFCTSATLNRSMLRHTWLMLATRGAAGGVPARPLPPPPANIRNATPGPTASAGAVRFRHAVRGEHLHHPVDVEVVDGETQVIDARRTRAGRAQRQELRSGPDAQDRDGTLVRLHRQPEQPLVELQRPLRIRHR